jgi:hypothetical protein
MGDVTLPQGVRASAKVGRTARQGSGTASMAAAIVILTSVALAAVSWCPKLVGRLPDLGGHIATVGALVQARCSEPAPHGLAPAGPSPFDLEVASQKDVVPGGGCWSLSATGDSVALRVHARMTLSDLAVHLRMSVAETRRACGLEDDRLRAGQLCRFAIPHLRPVLHQVLPGETLEELRRVYHVPTKYSIRTYNCLPSDRIRTGQTLLMLVPRDGRRVEG